VQPLDQPAAHLSFIIIIIIIVVEGFAGVSRLSSATTINASQTEDHALLTSLRFAGQSPEMGRPL